MANEVKIVIDDAKVRKAVNEAKGTEGKLQIVTQLIVGRANALSAGYLTPKWHDHATGETKGDKQPEYGGDVKRIGSTPVGIAHPDNYAAMKDNYLHNTMLKAIG